jgi:hypothetical protein
MITKLITILNLCWCYLKRCLCTQKLYLLQDFVIITCSFSVFVENCILLPKGINELNIDQSGRFGALKSDSTHHFFRNARVITVFTVFRLLTDFVCLYNYEFLLSLCKIARSSVIFLLPLFKGDKSKIHYFPLMLMQRNDDTCIHR